MVAWLSNAPLHPSFAYLTIAERVVQFSFELFRLEHGPPLGKLAAIKYRPSLAMLGYVS